jgi:hypothetical protein
MATMKDVWAADALTAKTKCRYSGGCALGTRRRDVESLGICKFLRPTCGVEPCRR